MVELEAPPAQAVGWPLRRRFAWTALFLAVIGWSSMVTPRPPPEVLPWDVTVPA